MSNENKIFTIPNLLSTFRLLLIPVIVWLYCVKEDFVWTTVVLVVSGITDMVDGYVARHFNMISNLGKALDPIADKLTQGVVLLCLVTRFPFVAVALVLFVVKEILNAVLHLVVIKRTGKVYGAEWHGKVTTVLLYVVMFLHVIWGNMPMAVSNVCVIICICMMVCSMVLYTYQSVMLLRKNVMSAGGEENVR